MGLIERIKKMAGKKEKKEEKQKKVIREEDFADYGEFLAAKKAEEEKK